MNARSGAGCSNRKSIRRKRVEEAVLEGLKVRLMAPEAVREFISEFNNELNRQHSQEELDKIEHVFELARVSKKIKGLYDAIADGLRTPGLKVELERLENRQAELQNLIESMPASQPRFHPKLAEVYRAMVSDLHAALDDPGARQEAAEILRGLVAEITVAPDGDGFLIGLTGEIVKLVTLPGGTVPKQYMGSVKVVAGAGFEPTTFRL
jgi:site-specific DNA recombinase